MMIYYTRCSGQVLPARLRGALPLWILLLFALSLSSCTIWDFDNWGDNQAPPESAIGMRPVYFPADSVLRIFSSAPRAQVNGTGIVASGKNLYIVELRLGVHVIDNTSSTSPVSLAFINIPGVTSITVDENRLFANNFEDLVTLDITDPRMARLIDRDPGFFPRPLDYPEGYIGFFECFDPSQGRLLRWEEELIRSPKCRI